MDNKCLIIAKNQKRVDIMNSYYNPYTGGGSPISRRELKHNDNDIIALPCEMFDDHFVKLVDSFGSVYGYVKANFPSCVTEKYIEIVNQIEKIRRRYDFEYWCFAYHYIQDAESGEVSRFTLRRSQRKVWVEVHKQIIAGLPIRIIIGKARQWGGSTFANALHRWIQVEIKFNWHSAICADVEEQAKNIRGQSDMMFERYPDKLTKKPWQHSTKNMVIAERGCVIGVGSMQKPDNLRGFAFKLLHLCVHPDTLIITDNGFLKKAKDINIGDYIITHTGAYSKIKNIDSGKPSISNGDGDGIVIKPWLSQPITLTPNHPVWTNKGWVNAGDLTKKDYLLIPLREIKDSIKTIQLGESGYRNQGGGSIPKSNNAIIELNSEIGFFIGYYLAEGSIHYRYKNNNRYPNQIALTRHDKDVSYGDRAVNAVQNIISSHNRNKRQNCLTTVENLYDPNLSKYIADNFGVKEFKTIPDWVFDCGKDFLTGLLQGYLSGDGSKTFSNQGNYELTEVNSRSISSSIAMQIRDIAASLEYGYAAIDIKEAGILHGRNCKKIYTVRWNGTSGRNIRRLLGLCVPNNGEIRSEKSFIKNGYVWLKIYKTTHTHLDLVYDIEVEHEDHSFRTISFPVKNTEVGFWKKTLGKKPEGLAQTLRAMVRKVAWTVIILESTAKGSGNFFHNEWLAAKAGGGYTPVFVPWFEIEMYQKPIQDYDKFIDWMKTDEYAMFLWELGATLEGINWYFNFRKSENYGVWEMNSEFPSTDLEMFSSTGNKAFSPFYIQKARKNNRPPMFVGDIFGDALFGKEALSNIRFDAYANGCCKIWAFPDNSVNCKNRYVIPVDIGGRSKTADFSIIRVIDRYPLLFGGVPEAILTWKGHLDQDLVIWKATQISYIYRKGLLVPEQNSLKKDQEASEGDHFLTLLDEVINYYDNIFCRTSPEQIRQGAAKRYGFHTGGNKADLITNVNKKLREEGYIEYDKEVCDEYDFYEIKPNGTYGAIDGQHDDEVMCTAIGLKASDLMDMPIIITEESKYKPSKQTISEATF